MSARELSNAECDALRHKVWADHDNFASKHWERGMIRAGYAAGRAAGMTKAAELAEAAATAYDDDQSARFVLGEYAAIIRALAEGKS